MQEFSTAVSMLLPPVEVRVTQAVEAGEVRKNPTVERRCFENYVRLDMGEKDTTQSLIPRYGGARQSRTGFPLGGGLRYAILPLPPGHDSSDPGRGEGGPPPSSWRGISS